MGFEYNLITKRNPIPILFFLFLWIRITETQRRRRYRRPNHLFLLINWIQSPWLGFGAMRVRLWKRKKEKGAHRHRSCLRWWWSDEWCCGWLRERFGTLIALPPWMEDIRSWIMDHGPARTIHTDFPFSLVSLAQPNTQCFLSIKNSLQFSPLVFLFFIFYFLYIN